MPLTTLRPILTQRFHEVENLLNSIAEQEPADPHAEELISVKIIRGLFFVHLYAAFEFAIDQSFIRLAQHITGLNVSQRHLHRPVFSVAIDEHFSALQDIRDWHKKYNRRLATLACVDAADPAAIRDTVLSFGLQSADPATIETTFRAYGITKVPFTNLPTRTYLAEVVSKRHAIAHGRESPVIYGNMRAADLRIRFSSLYQQATYVVDTLNEFANQKKFVRAGHRDKY